MLALFKIINLNVQAIKSILQPYSKTYTPCNLNGEIIHGWIFPKYYHSIMNHPYLLPSLHITFILFLRKILNENVPQFFSHERGRSKIHSSKCRQQKSFLFLVEISKKKQHPRSPKCICQSWSAWTARTLMVLLFIVPICQVYILIHKYTRLYRILYLNQKTLNIQQEINDRKAAFPLLYITHRHTYVRVNTV